MFMTLSITPGFCHHHHHQMRASSSPEREQPPLSAHTPHPPWDLQPKSRQLLVSQCLPGSLSLAFLSSVAWHPLATACPNLSRVCPCSNMPPRTSHSPFPQAPVGGHFWLHHAVLSEEATVDKRVQCFCWFLFLILVYCFVCGQASIPLGRPQERNCRIS